MTLENEQTSIYSYNDPALFLRDHWLKKKQKNPQFSIRAWAKSMNMTSHSLLHQMLYGTRSIPKKYLQTIVKSLELGPKEVEYLENLINIQKAKTVDEKSFYLEKIKYQHKESSAVFKEVENFEMVRNPLHFFILEVVSLKKRSLNVELIKKRLNFNYTTEEIHRALDTLINLGLMVKVGQDEYAKVHKTLFTKNDVPSRALKDYHKKMADLGKIAIDEQDVNAREFSGMTFNINKSDMNTAKAMLREFREKFVERFETRECEGDQTYHLQMNFFGITKDSYEDPLY